MTWLLLLWLMCILYICSWMLIYMKQTQNWKRYAKNMDTPIWTSSLYIKTHCPTTRTRYVSLIHLLLFLYFLVWEGAVKIEKEVGPDSEWTLSLSWRCSMRNTCTWMMRSATSLKATPTLMSETRRTDGSGSPWAKVTWSLYQLASTIASLWTRPWVEQLLLKH